MEVKVFVTNNMIANIRNIRRKNCCIEWDNGGISKNCNYMRHKSAKKELLSINAYQHRMTSSFLQICLSGWKYHRSGNSVHVYSNICFPLNLFMSKILDNQK